MIIRSTTVVHALEDAARSAGERVAFRFLSDGDAQVESITFRELQQRSLAMANVIRQYAVRGDRAILFAETRIETVVALYACLQAGVIAVPAAAPHRNRIQTRAKTLLNIVRSCSPRLVLAGANVFGMREELAGAAWEIAVPKWLCIDAVPDEASSQYSAIPLPEVRDVAFLQYTSGTMSQPRGVIVTHSALLANQRMIHEASPTAHQAEWGISWLPFFHDMGISFLFHAVLLQSTCTLLSPGHFVQAPVRWLKAMSQYGSALSATPNFALDLVLAKVTASELETLDLRSLKVLIVGAEPVRAGTLRRLVEKLGPAGFNAQALLPCFGLAESTLMATHPRRGGIVARRFGVEALARGAAEDEADTARRSIELVGNGGPGQHHSMLVVDPQTRRPLPEKTVGEIWLQGPSIGAGYWNDPDTTRTVFEAEPDPPDGKRYLRTGDLGFQCEGELFVAGRLKDLIIVAGRNIYPKDVELVAEEVDRRIVRGGVAAFEHSLGEGVGVAILAELNRNVLADAEELAMRIRAYVASEMEVDVTYVGLLPQRKLPRTTSGKISRVECRRLLEQSELTVLSEWRPHASA